MGVDPRLLDLCLEANRDEMYVLSSLEAKAMMVANNGRQPTEWSVAASPRGARLHANRVRRRVRIRPSRRSERGVDMEASADDRKVGRDPRGGADGVVHSTFVLPPNLVRLAMSARHIGYRMKRASNRVPSIDFRVDVDGRSAATARRFLGDCLRRAK